MSHCLESRGSPHRRAGASPGHSRARKAEPQAESELRALREGSGCFPPVRGFPVSLGSLPLPHTSSAARSREPWSRAGCTPPCPAQGCGAAAGARGLGSAARASPDAEPHAEGLPATVLLLEQPELASRVALL